MTNFVLEAVLDPLAKVEMRKFKRRNRREQGEITINTIKRTLVSYLPTLTFHLL